MKQYAYAGRTSISRLLQFGVCLLLVGALAVSGCRPRSPAETEKTGQASEKQVEEPGARNFQPLGAGGPVFKEVTGKSPDLAAYSYRNGQDKGLFAIIESLGGGVGVIDYDKDGWYDLIFPGGGDFADDGQGGKKPVGYPCRVFRNQKDGSFADVTAQVLPEQALFYSHGIAVCDYDRDGWPDFLVTGYGRVALYHNVPDGKGGRKFVDATAEAGLLKEGHFWSTSAVFADLDGDGWPDLYLCQYVSWSLKNNPECPGYRPGIKRDVCPPRTFETRQHAVYRSTGKGGFEDVTAASGIRLEADFPKARSLRPQKPQFWYCGAGLAVLAADIVNGKGRPDLYVANDETGNFLYQNDSTPGHIRLTEVAESLGATGSSKGTPTGSMGVDMADIDGSGKPSLFVTNFQHEQHALYRMVGGKIFVHSTDEAQLDNRGRTMVGWGTAFLDLDNDGWPDVVIAHGHVVRHPKNSDLLQLPGLFANNGDSQGKFRRIAGQGGDYFHETHLGRGLAVADFDNDGWADLVINHTNAAPAVLQNVFKSTNHSGNHWLGVHLIGSGYRDVTGARAVLKVGARRVTRFQKAGGSYAASQDPRLIFGIGDADKVNSLTVYWPTGTPKQETWLGLDIDRYHTLRQGSSPMATLKSEETPPQGQKQ